MKPLISFISTTRADWGLLRPLAAALRQTGTANVNVIVSNTHLDTRFGATQSEIEADGIEIAARVPVDTLDDSPEGRAKAMGTTTTGVAEALGRIRPQAVVALGDRTEMLGAVSAAAVMGIPVIHIAGGEITEGAVDNAMRHAITKLATLHLTSTEEYRQNVIQMGEDPQFVVATGAIGAYEAALEPSVTAADLEQYLNMKLHGHRILAVTYHPATAGETATHGELMQNLTEALEKEEFADCAIVMTYPNNDAGSNKAIQVAEEFAQRHPQRVRLVKSLGAARYLGLLHIADAVVGNSSSGLVEAPSAGAPTVNIGFRQHGRAMGPSVICTATDAESIATAIREAFKPEYKALASPELNPYYAPQPIRTMVEAIARFMESPCEVKHFYHTK